jgi:hypothetical protein
MQTYKEEHLETINSSRKASTQEKRDCKYAATPYFFEVRLEDGGDTTLVDNTLYKQLVGSFLYLSHT